MGIYFSIYVVDKKVLEEIVDKISKHGINISKDMGFSEDFVIEVEDMGSLPLYHLLYYAKENKKLKAAEELRDDSGYLPVGLMHTLDKLAETDPNNELVGYLPVVNHLCSGEYSSQKVFSFESQLADSGQKLITESFLRDAYDGYVTMLNTKDSEKFIGLLKKLLEKNLTYCTYPDQVNVLIIDKEEDGAEDIRTEIEDIIKIFYDFQASEKCLIGFYH